MMPRLLFALCACWWLGCAARAPFASSFPSDDASWSRVLAQAKRGVASPQRSVVVGATEAPRAVFAYDLDKKQLLFRTEADATAAPVAAGAFMVVPEPTRVTIRRLQDGAIVHQLPNDGMHFAGADGDGSTTAVVLTTGSTLRSRSRLVLMQGEQITADEEVPRALGRPAVLGGLAFVPHGHVHLSAIAPDGRELARLRIQHDVASYALVHAGDVYFGQRALTRVAERGDESERGSAALRLALKRKLPGAPALLPDTHVPPPAIDSAVHRINMSLLPRRRGAALTVQNDTLYATFYRLIFALTPDASEARWVHEAESDVVGLQAVDDGLFAIERSGNVLLFDAQAGLQDELSLGLEPAVASVRANTTGASARTDTSEPTWTQLARVLRGNDARLVPARLFAASLLGAAASDEAAQALIGVCGEPDLPEAVREAACTALSQRGLRSDAVIAGLAKQANFLDAAAAPPLAPLARAAALADDRRAVPHLLMHLGDPATSSEDLVTVVQALSRLGDPAAAPKLASFVRLYHADVLDPSHHAALTLSMQTLAKLDAARVRPLLEPIAADALAAADVRADAQRVLSTLGTEADETDEADGSDEARAPGVSVTEAAVEAEEEWPREPPAHLTTQHIDEALSPVRVELARCVRAAPEHPASARIVIVINGEGRATQVKTLPESVAACAAPLIHATTFPATKYGRRSVMSYIVTR